MTCFVVFHPSEPGGNHRRRNQDKGLGYGDAGGISYPAPGVKEVIARARKAGFAVIAMKTMLAIDTRRPLETPADLIRDGMNAAQSALKWVLQDRNVDTTVPGMTTFEHLAQDLAVMGSRMGFLDRRTLIRYAGLREGGACGGVAGCDGCGGNVHSAWTSRPQPLCQVCHGYGDIGLARENSRDLPASSKVDACSGCDECVVKCAHGLNLTETVRSARRLFA